MKAQEMLSWDINKSELGTIRRIASRAFNLAAKANADLDGGLQSVIEMDIAACHCNGNPLKLEELCEADDGNFLHDVLGIRINLNRETGRLENCFVPRFSRQHIHG